MHTYNAILSAIYLHYHLPILQAQDARILPADLPGDRNLDHQQETGCTQVWSGSLQARTEHRSFQLYCCRQQAASLEASIGSASSRTIALVIYTCRSRRFSPTLPRAALKGRDAYDPKASGVLQKFAKAAQVKWFLEKGRDEGEPEGRSCGADMY